MNPKIYHETIDSRFIEYLKSIGLEEFLRQFDLDKKCYKEFYVDYFFNEKFDFLFPNVKDAVYRMEVQFEIEHNEGSFYVTKDREFNMINLKNGHVISYSPECHDFAVMMRSWNYKGLQHEFDKWYDYEAKNN